MLTPDEQRAWDTYVAEMAQRGETVDLTPLIEVLLSLTDYPFGAALAEALAVDEDTIEALAQRLTLQTRAVVETGRVPR